MDLLIEFILIILSFLGELLFDVWLLWKLDFFPEARRAHERAAATTRLPDTPKSSLIRAVSYLLLGSLLGWISFKLMPHAWLTSTNIQKLNILLMPLISGICYTLLKSKLCAIRFKQPMIWHWLWFFQASLFALAFNVTRYYFLHHN